MKRVMSHLLGFASLFGLGHVNPGRVYGPRVTATKNIGKLHVYRARSRYMPQQGTREIARRKRQIDAGQLRVAA